MTSKSKKKQQKTTRISFIGLPVNEAQFGVGPVDLGEVVVECQSVGPVDVFLDDDLSAARGPVHPCALDLWDLSPVRPVHVPAARHHKTYDDPLIHQNVTEVDLLLTGFRSV